MAEAGTEARPTDVLILVPKLYLGTQLCPKLGLGNSLLVPKLLLGNLLGCKALLCLIAGNP
jgi:hypothetical protein